MTTTMSTPTDSATQDGGEPVRVLVLIGSTRVDRFGPVPAGWVAEQAAQRADIEVEVVDLADPPLPVVMPGFDSDAPLPVAVTDLGARLAAADAVVIVTPVYNRGYPASLKNAIDWFHAEWAARPVGFVSYGGRTGGVEAVEQLRTVFVELGTMTVRNVLSFPNFWEYFTDDGAPADPAAMAGAATAFYDQLLWWAKALRTARHRDAHPMNEITKITQEDETLIRSIVADIEQGFNHNDPELLARHIADEAVIISPLGRVMRGPAAVEESARELLIGGSLGTATAHYRLTEISLLAPDVAVAQKSAWSTPNEADDGAPPQMVSLYVFVRHDDRWWISRRQNTTVRS